MEDVTLHHIEPYTEGKMEDWVKRYAIILGVPLTLSEKDLCYRNLFQDLLEYIKEAHGKDNISR